MVNSISKTVQNLIDEDLSLQDALQRDYANYSAIARMLMPKIKETADSSVNIESIITAVKRAKANYTILQGKITKGNSVVTLISDLNSFSRISSIFAKKDVIDQKQNLSTVIIRSPDEITSTPGCVQAFYNAVSRRHINIEETMSCYTETIIVLAMEDVSKAFAALTDLITEARTKTA
jgi:aspartokinase